ncbi:MAG: hypothetical protein ABR553_10760, partial [Gammaproteobacteria bacterium]
MSKQFDVAVVGATGAV